MLPDHMNQQYTKNRRLGGFTLVEVMITVLLAAIVMGLAVPTFRSLTTSSRLSSQTNDLISVLTFARSEAITKNVRHTFCRADSAAATECDADDAVWEHWIILRPDGEVVRRGIVPTFGGTLIVVSSLVGNAVTFGSDGLARTGGALVNADDDDAHFFRICITTQSEDNIRELFLGGGSRATTVKESGTC